MDQKNGARAAHADQPARDANVAAFVEYFQNGCKPKASTLGVEIEHFLNTIRYNQGVPVAFGLLFGLRKVFAKSTRRSRADALIVSDGIQEMLDTAREIRATNQVERHLGELEAKIDTPNPQLRKSGTLFGRVNLGL